MPIDIGIQCISAYPCNPRHNNKLIAILSNLIRFFVLILGAFTPPPQILEPVTNIPLKTMTKKFINAYHHFSMFTMVNNAQNRKFSGVDADTLP